MGLSADSDTLVARSRKTSWRVNALLTLFSLGLSLLLAEALLRWVGYDHPQFYRLDPLVG